MYPKSQNCVSAGEYFCENYIVFQISFMFLFLSFISRLVSSSLYLCNSNVTNVATNLHPNLT